MNMEGLLALLLQQIVTQAPALAVELIAILSKDKYTDADFEALAAKYRGKTYEEYILANQKPC